MASTVSGRTPWREIRRNVERKPALGGTAEAKRLHALHCSGCTAYGGEHGGERTRPTVGGDARLRRDAGFDSPPPPSHTHTPECLEC